MFTGVAGCKDPCCCVAVHNQPHGMNSYLPETTLKERPEAGKLNRNLPVSARRSTGGNSGKSCVNVNTFYLFITNSLFSREDGNPPRQSNYIIEGWGNLWAPLLISTVSWTVRPTTTRSGESAARHKRPTDVIVLYKYKWHLLSPRGLHAANALKRAILKSL